jgi:hypothetical protein
MSNILENANMTNVMPLINSAASAISTIIGGLEQRDSNYAIAEMAERQTRSKVLDQQVQNRIVKSAVRTRAVQNQGRPDLDILMQVAGQAEVQILRIKDSGKLTAAYYRNVGDQAAWQAGSEGIASLITGVTQATDLGLFESRSPTTSPTIATAKARLGSSAPIVATPGPTTAAPGSSSPTLVPLGP